MRRHFALPLGGALLGLSLLLPAGASAHEARNVGKYHFVVGFLNEPTIQNQLNGIEVTITTTADKKPVVGANKTLKAEVIVGGNAKVMPVSLEPASDEDPNNGKYAAYFIPTMAGSYIFRFTGNIDGDPIDQRFESGPNTFDDVQPAAPLEFPQKLADAAALQAQVAGAQAAASSARTLAIIGIVVGIVGLAAGIAGWTRRTKGPLA